MSEIRSKKTKRVEDLRPTAAQLKNERSNPGMYPTAPKRTPPPMRDAARQQSRQVNGPPTTGQRVGARGSTLRAGDRITGTPGQKSAVSRPAPGRTVPTYKKKK